MRFWLVAVVAYHALPLLFDVIAWRRLFIPPAPGWGRIALARWVGEGVNSVLPIPHLGEFLRARAVRSADHDGVAAAASVLADITLGFSSQILFIVLGLALFALHAGADVLASALAATTVLALLATGFYAAQRLGLLTLIAEKMSGWLNGESGFAGGAAFRRLDATLNRIYRRPGPVFVGLAWHFAGWIVGAGEIWLVLRALGTGIGAADAIALESLSQAARSLAFVIPAGLGVQDGALMVLAMQTGVPADLALTLALVKRCRELALGLPALVACYVLEKKAWRRRRGAAAALKSRRARSRPPRR